MPTNFCEHFGSGKKLLVCQIENIDMVLPTGVYQPTSTWRGNYADTRWSLRLSWEDSCFCSKQDCLSEFFSSSILIFSVVLTISPFELNGSGVSLFLITKVLSAYFAWCLWDSMHAPTEGPWRFWEFGWSRCPL